MKHFDRGGNKEGNGHRLWLNEPLNYSALDDEQIQGYDRGHKR